MGYKVASVLQNLQQRLKGSHDSVTSITVRATAGKGTQGRLVGFKEGCSEKGTLELSPER